MRLAEDELARIYDVSRTVVRSALQALIHEQLVTHIPNKGVTISKPSRFEAREVFEARALLEPYLASLAARRATADDVAVLRAHIRDEHAAIERDQDTEAIALSALFHRKIAKIAGQSILEGYMDELVARSSLIVALYWKRHDSTCEKHAHSALVNAIEAGDAKDASELMKSHLVDVLSGLDLSRVDSSSGRSLAEILVRID
jgi:DNA-binding GntR family transcriptional regulator